MTQLERAERLRDLESVDIPLWTLIDPNVTTDDLEKAIAADIRKGIARKRELAAFERRIRRI